MPIKQLRMPWRSNISAQQYFGAASPADNYFTLWQNNALTAQWHSLCGYFFASITDPIPVPVSRLKQPTVTE